jgi:hypothetical protein
LFVGRNDAAFESTSISGLQRFHLRLPVTVRSLNLRVNADQHGDTDLLFQPTNIIDPPLRRAATHAARFGNARAFFFDELAYAERDGFWMRAHSTTTVVVDTQQPGSSGLPLSVTAGAVPTRIDLSSGGWQQSLSLDAGQRRDVTLPPSTGNVWSLTIRSGAGFRPSERDPANRDVRLLSAWITLTQ